MTAEELWPHTRHARLVGARPSRNDLYVDEAYSGLPAKESWYHDMHVIIIEDITCVRVAEVIGWHEQHNSEHMAALLQERLDAWEAQLPQLLEEWEAMQGLPPDEQRLEGEYQVIGQPLSGAEFTPNS